MDPADVPIRSDTEMDELEDRRGRPAQIVKRERSPSLGGIGGREEDPDRELDRLLQAQNGVAVPAWLDQFKQHLGVDRVENRLVQLTDAVVGFTWFTDSLGGINQRLTALEQRAPHEPRVDQVVQQVADLQSVLQSRSSIRQWRASTSRPSREGREGGQHAPAMHDTDFSHIVCGGCFCSGTSTSRRRYIVFRRRGSGPAVHRTITSTIG